MCPLKYLGASIGINKKALPLYGPLNDLIAMVKRKSVHWKNVACVSHLCVVIFKMALKKANIFQHI